MLEQYYEYIDTTELKEFVPFKKKTLSATRESLMDYHRNTDGQPLLGHNHALSCRIHTVRDVIADRKLMVSRTVV